MKCYLVCYNFTAYVMKKYKGEFILLLTSIIWGGGFIATDVSLDSLTPLQVMTFRFLIATAVLSIIFINKLRGINRDVLKKGILIGFFLFVGFVFQTVGLKYTTVSNNAFLSAIAVIFVPLIGLLFKKKIDRYGIIGTALTVIGVGVLTVEGNFSSINIGDILTIIGSIFYAMQIILVDSFAKEEDVVVLTIVQIAACFLFSLIVMVIRGDLYFAHTVSGIGGVIYLGLFSTAIGLFLQVLGQKTTTETRAAIIMVTESVFGTIFAIVLLNQLLTTRVIIACIIIFVAIIISEIKPLSRKVKE